jgi:hypothetical protein
MNYSKPSFHWSDQSHGGFEDGRFRRGGGGFSRGEGRFGGGGGFHRR